MKFIYQTIGMWILVVSTQVSSVSVATETYNSYTREGAPRCSFKEATRQTFNEIMEHFFYIVSREPTYTDDKVKEIKIQADKGDVEAQLSLGRIYGRLYKFKDDDLSFKYYQLAADQENAKAQFHIGVMYGEGRGVEKDEDLEFKYYQLSADQGYIFGQLGLAKLYARTSNITFNVFGRKTVNPPPKIKQDYVLALKYFQLAADQKIEITQPIELRWAQHNALIRLGNMYETGQGVTQDYALAVQYYKLAADKGDIDALNILGAMYRDGRGVKQDYKLAIKYYKLAADIGYAESQYHLAMIYDQGSGYFQDDDLALKYYQLASNQRHSRAQYRLGVKYIQLSNFSRRDDAEKVLRLVKELDNSKK